MEFCYYYLPKNTFFDRVAREVYFFFFFEINRKLLLQKSSGMKGFLFRKLFKKEKQAFKLFKHYVFCCGCFFLILFVSHGGSLSSTSNVSIKICDKYQVVSKSIKNSNFLICRCICTSFFPIKSIYFSSDQISTSILAVSNLVIAGQWIVNF